MSECERQRDRERSYTVVIIRLLRHLNRIYTIEMDVRLYTVYTIFEANILGKKGSVARLLSLVFSQPDDILFRMIDRLSTKSKNKVSFFPLSLSLTTPPLRLCFWFGVFQRATVYRLFGGFYFILVDCKDTPLI